MANEEHLKILKRGVEEWNAWREEHPDIRPDLSHYNSVFPWDDEDREGREMDLPGIDLSRTDLTWANLRLADLSKANLNGANLWHAEMIDANLNGANVELANLYRADLTAANLTETNLTAANLVRANLSQANLWAANLSGATMHETTLCKANLESANLKDTDLRRANLKGACLKKATLLGSDLSEADLSEANLTSVDLFEAFLYKTILVETNLELADLRYSDMCKARLERANLTEARLMGTKLEDATLTGAYLYGTVRDDWIINKIRCEYVYWDYKPVFKKDEGEQEEQWKREHRVPKDRNFAPGEFEQLYMQPPQPPSRFEQSSVAVLIEQGESSILEFKSTLQWDVKQNRENKELCKSCLKTIAAFLNSDGGVLVIGVEDDGTVFGLQPDFSLVKGKNRDGFEQKLMSLIRDYLGLSVARFIKVCWERLNEEDVCAIDIKKAAKPVFMKEKGRKIFYIRLGNTTHELDIEEAHEYIGTHWK